MAYVNTNAAPRAEISQAVFEAQSKDTSLPFIGLEVAPILGVPARSGEYIKIDVGPGEIFNPDALKTAPGADRSRVTRRFTTDNFTTGSFELEELLPDETSSDLGRYFDVEVSSAAFLNTQLLLGHEQRVADLVFGSGLTAISAVAAYTAGAGANLDVAQDVDLAQVELAKKNVQADTLICSLQVFNRLRRSTKLLTNIFGAVKTDVRPASAQEVAEALGLSRILIGRAAKNGAKKGQSFSASFVWGNSKIAVAKLGGGEFTAGGLARTLLWQEDSPVPVVTETYRDEARRSNVIRVRHNVSEKIIDASMVCQIDTSYA
jgi:predicted RNA methylase